ncbi:hypothetical protein GCM10023191_042110 [Actinoallomurus oryzae]|uniref:Uncharacterized protein n=2 Tax=Actinoallomurus oryzae TaxID=502180 RepID=A0ABP8Q5J3_9ACTN
MLYVGYWRSLHPSDGSNRNPCGMPIGILSLFISAISVAPLLVATVKKWVGWWWATAHYVLVTASVGLIVCAALYDRSGI